jgi:GDP-L-fucose synthase
MNSFIDLKILVAGSTGLVGSSLLRKLTSLGAKNLLTPRKSELDLLNQSAVKTYFEKHRPELVINAAAKVGGIQANSIFKSEFIFENLQIQNNLIRSALDSSVETFVFLGSSCIYPKHCRQPMSELDLLTGQLEPTNRPYAIAKIAGLELISAIRSQHRKNYYSVMPTNLYGPNDNFHPENSHVLPGLIHKIHTAKQNSNSRVELWGTGKPLREFLFVDDCADAILFLADKVKLNTFENTALGESGWCHINIGTNKEISIEQLAIVIKEIVGFKGNFVFNSIVPDGTPRKLLDSSFINKLGWQPKISLMEGIKMTYKYYLENIGKIKFQ